MKFVPIDNKKKTREMRSWKETKFLYGVYRVDENDSNLFGYIIKPKKIEGLCFWACGEEQWLLPWELAYIAHFIEDKELELAFGGKL